MASTAPPASVTFATAVTVGTDLIVSIVKGFDGEWGIASGGGGETVN
jgi:hypothetical protein